ncbi:protein asteroid homolog 1-like [Diachasmimorpha longicaudata]|uniref:protein asteroid homolog 1-like n=1 Tax=Diachasmimorpha longicaudata TaxID=58733 RepID=UPI0030B8749D
MGIRGLSSYILQNDWRFMEPFELQGMTIVVDASNVCHNLYEMVDKQSGLMGCQYDVFYRSVKNFFENLLLCEVQPIVILDGLAALTQEQYLMIFQDKLKQFVSGDSMIFPQLLNRVLISVLRRLKIQFVQTASEADESIVAIAEALNCPILSEDGDFFMYSTNYIHWKTLNLIPHKVQSTSSFSLSCQMYNFRKLCNAFNDLNESLLRLALIILGNKCGRNHLDDNIMKSLFDRINSIALPHNPHVSQRKIEKTLLWLSDYSSLDEAITGVLQYVDSTHKAKVFQKIQHMLDEFGICSPLVFINLELPERLLSKLRDNMHKKPVPAQQIETNEKKNNALEYTEEELIAMVPKWMTEDFARGRLFQKPFEMLLFSTAFMSPVRQTCRYPPPAFISLSIVKSIYSLLCSLREGDEHNLNIIAANETKVIREQVKVDRSSVSLKDIKKLEHSERKRIIDEVLGTDGDNSLQELPSCWRLYVAAMVFWMRQKDPPERTRNHLFSVILVMLLSFINDKIGVLKTKDAFMEKYEAKYKEITSKNKPDRRVMEIANLRDALQSATEEECIAAAPFFISNQQLNRPKNEWKIVVHTFSQFHSCLENAMTLNALLAFPYYPVEVYKVYSGLLFYTLFEAISKEDDIEAYLHKELPYSPEIHFIDYSAYNSPLEILHPLELCHLLPCHIVIDTFSGEKTR